MNAGLAANRCSRSAQSWVQDKQNLEPAFVLRITSISSSLRFESARLHISFVAMCWLMCHCYRAFVQCQRSQDVWESAISERAIVVFAFSHLRAECLAMRAAELQWSHDQARNRLSAFAYCSGVHVVLGGSAADDLSEEKQRTSISVKEVFMWSNPSVRER